MLRKLALALSLLATPALAQSTPIQNFQTYVNQTIVPNSQSGVTPGNANTAFNMLVPILNGLSNGTTVSITGDLGCTPGNPLKCLLVSYNGQPLEAALLPHVTNNTALTAYTKYTQPVVRDGFSFPGDGGRVVYNHASAACTISGGDGGSQIPAADGGCWRVDMPDGISRPEWFGSTGIVGTDDTPKIMAASRVFNNGGGVVQLRCGVQYQINSTLAVGASTTSGSNSQPFVAVRGCTSVPKNVSVTNGFTGQINTLGGLWRAQGVSIQLAQGDSLENLVVWQQGVVFGQDGVQNFDNSSAVMTTQGGGTGMSTSMRNVAIIGGGTCYDGTVGGGNSVTVENVMVDCQNTGFYIGPSFGGSYFNNLLAFPLASAGFNGYTITSIVGDGTTTTVSYSGTPSRAPAVGDYVQIMNAKFTAGGVAYSASAANAQYASPAQKLNANWIVTAVSANSVSFASTTNTTTNPVNIANATLLDENTTQYRSGTGFLVAPNTSSDDSYFGKLSDFGNAIGFDYEGRGIFTLTALYLDNNLTNGAVINSKGAPVHIGELEALETGTGNGLTILGNGSFVQIAQMDISNTQTPVVVGPGATLQLGPTLLDTCSQYGINVSPTAFLHGSTLKTRVCGPSSFPGSTVPSLITAGSPLTSVTFENITTDLLDGQNVYNGGTGIPSASVSGTTINLPASSGTSTFGKCDQFQVPGNGILYNLIGGGWSGRCVRLLFTGTSQLGSGNNVALSSNQAFGGAAGSIITLVFDSTAGGTYGGVYREQGRNTRVLPSAYTTANLPACSATTQDQTYVATDLTNAGTFGAAPTGGGTARGLVYCNGSAYTVH